MELVKGLSADGPAPGARSAGAAHLLPVPSWALEKAPDTNAIERCFVEVRRRTRPMVVFTNVASADRIIFAIFSRCNEAWKNRTLEIFTQAA